MVQLPTGKVALEKLILPEPAVAVTDPPQLLTTPGEVATTRLPGTVPTLAGRLSVKLASIGATLRLLMLNVTVLTLVPVPAVVSMVLGEKLLVIEGGCKTIMLELAVPELVELGKLEEAVV